MTYSLSVEGHHNSDDWKKEEYDILEGVVKVFTSDPSTVVSHFSFNGNHVSADSIDDAISKIEASKVGSDG